MSITVGVHLPLFSGQEDLVLFLKPRGSGIAINPAGDALVEELDGDDEPTGYFEATVAETATGVHRAVIENGSGVNKAQGWTNLDDAAPVIDELLEGVLSAVAGISGGGGEGTVKYVARVVNGGVSPIDLTAYRKGGRTHEVFVENEDGGSVSMSGKTLQAVLFQGETEKEIGYASVTISGTGHNKLTWTFPATLHAKVGKHSWAVREPSNDQYVWAHGAYAIEFAAGPHA